MGPDEVDGNVEAEADENYCHSLVDDEAIEDLKGNGVEGGDDESHVERQWNHCVYQQQYLQNTYILSFYHT